MILGDLLVGMFGMQRKSTKQSPCSSAGAAKFMEWCKHQPSIVSGIEGVEVHHCAGSTAKIIVGAERAMIGHWFLLPLTTDEHWLYHNRKRQFISQYGKQVDLWERLILDYPGYIPEIIIKGVILWGK